MNQNYNEQETVFVRQPGWKKLLAPLAVIMYFLTVSLLMPSTAKWVTAILIPVTLFVCIFRSKQLRARISLPLLVLALMVLMDGISTLYSVSGKFALNEYLKVAAAFCLVLLSLALARGEGVQLGRNLAGLLEGFTALVSLISIDLLSTRVLSGGVLWLFKLVSSDYLNLRGVEVGTRMISLYTNPNVYAGLTGIGVLLTLGMALSVEKGKSRALHLACLVVNSVGFLLAFSMGASAMIALAFLVYLLLEFKNRRAALLLLMIETLLVSAVAVVPTAMYALEQWDGIQPIPLACLVFSFAVLLLLEEFVGKPLSKRLANHGKAMLIIVGAMVALIAAFILLAYNLTGAAALKEGDKLERGIYPEAGQYTLNLQADGDVTVRIASQNEQETMMHTQTVLYKGDAADAVFTVPEDSQVVYITFTAGEDLTLESAQCVGADDTVKVPLGYKLLPGFVANRLQGLFANENAIQRFVFFEDGLKLFRRSPAVGLGMGSFENGIKSVQPFYYATKYAHNHYIQTMAETGIVGLILFVGQLALCAVLVLLTRRKGTGHPLTPALGAALVFMAGHAAVEVVFSVFCYLPVAFGVFALIGLCCGDAIPTGWMGKKVRGFSLLGMCAVLLAFFVLLCGNLIARRTVEKATSFNTLEYAVRIDRYEWADYAISYVMASPNFPGVYEIQRNALDYAARMEQLQSNSVHLYLAEYYFKMGETTNAMQSVDRHLEYVSSDSAEWERTVKLLMAYESDSDAFRAGVQRLGQSLKEWNEANIGDVVLGEEYLIFLHRMGVSFE